ncbi:hypothetical protein FB451DRAFT_1474739 [Mycena latifolia]|nr:hypothetical protein FB451DRAFT_1474739 [Mycena latifolia]
MRAPPRCTDSLAPVAAGVPSPAKTKPATKPAGLTCRDMPFTALSDPLGPATPRASAAQPVFKTSVCTQAEQFSPIEARHLRGDCPSLPQNFPLSTQFRTPPGESLVAVLDLTLNYYSLVFKPAMCLPASRAIIWGAASPAQRIAPRNLGPPLPLFAKIQENAPAFFADQSISPSLVRVSCVPQSYRLLGSPHSLREIGDLSAATISLHIPDLQGDRRRFVSPLSYDSPASRLRSSQLHASI